MDKVKLLAVGDIYLQTRNGKHPFEGVKQIFKDKDILFGNLETVLSNYGRKTEKAVSLHTSPEKVFYLTDARFDILNIANNHMMDLGLEGFNETLEVLNRNNLKFVGAGNQKFNQPYQIIDKRGIRFGFLGYWEGGFRDPKESVFINRINEENISADIRNLRLQCDFIIISLHWGIENVFYPSPQQIKLARHFIDSGATLILGHHSHAVQGLESYKNGLIAYSLGNFQFEAEKEKTRRSIILSVEISKNGIENYKAIPIRIDENFLPYPMDNKNELEMLAFIDTISDPIVKNMINERWWFEEISSEHLRGNMKSWIIRIKKYGIKHFIECIRWLISPFIIKCYFGLLRRSLRKHD